MKFGGMGDCGPEKSSFYFGSNPEHILDNYIHFVLFISSTVVD